MEGATMSESLERLRKFIDEWKAVDGVGMTIKSLDGLVADIEHERTPYDTQVYVEDVRDGQPRHPHKARVTASRDARRGTSPA